tara:strand:+ start:1527 stop:1781 length:255 start_codon:yes stop_codon:yes gene_type:complete
MKGLIVIEDNWSLFKGEVQEVDVIGVAENMGEARRMRDQYFGRKLVITETQKIEESGLECIEKYIDSDGDIGSLVYRYFDLNEI